MYLQRPEGEMDMAVDLEEYIPFWKKLTRIEQGRMSVSARERRFLKGNVLHRGYGECTGLILVLKGRLRVYIISDEKKELTLYRLFDRDICLLSAPCMMKSIKFDVIVEAEQDTDILHIPVEAYKKVMEENVAAAVFTNEIMAARFSDVMWLMDQVLNKKMDSRLAAFLLEESGLCGSRTMAVTHDQIARHMGTAREVVTRILRVFQSDGLVRLNRGEIKLLDRRRLEKLAEGSLR